MLRQRITWLLDYPRFFRELVSGRRLREEQYGVELLEANCRPFVDLDVPKSILDLGSGMLHPRSTLLSSKGHRVASVDIEYRNRVGLKAWLYGWARWLFQLWLPRKPSPVVRMVCADVSSLPFESESFDLITSAAAFEHFLEVPKVLKEARRVLKPGGIIFASIDVFSSLMGGHNVSRSLGLRSELPVGVEPWDHLRKRKLPFTVPLNRLRIKEFEQLFAENFEILLSQKIGSEGENLLTDEIRRELPDYSDEELTLKAYLVLARRIRSD